MSKPYFAKFLPVKGETKPGEKYKHFPDSMILTRSLLSTNTDPDEEDFYKNIVKKVKLFLCSRDIQLGDEVTNIDTGKKRTLTTKAELSLAEMQIRALVKVIGEISPEATYVKEGDEFDENEIDLLSYGVNCIIVKGPCGRFH